MVSWRATGACVRGEKWKEISGYWGWEEGYESPDPFVVGSPEKCVIFVVNERKVDGVVWTDVADIMNPK